MKKEQVYSSPGTRVHSRQGGWARVKGLSNKIESGKNKDGTGSLGLFIPTGEHATELRPLIVQPARNFYSI